MLVNKTIQYLLAIGSSFVHLPKYTTIMIFYMAKHRLFGMGKSKLEEALRYFNEVTGQVLSKLVKRDGFG